MSKRKKIPKKAESEILVKSRRRCCLCYGLFGDFRVKQGQIAHISHDSSNNNLENLVFLCLEHHDNFDSQTSQSKAMTESEVRFYRGILYKDIADQLPRLEKDSLDAIRKNYEGFHQFIKSLRSSQPLSSGFLNDFEIEKANEAGFLGIEPFDKARLYPASYHMSLGDEALVGEAIFSILHMHKERLPLEPGTSAFVQTREFIFMPLGLMGRICPIASRLTGGLRVSVGSHIDPGFTGRLTISIENRGHKKMEISYGESIIAVEFIPLSLQIADPHKGHVAL